MPKVKILDCTLRDGGYINNWYFGRKNIDCVLDSLINSNVDIIEVGFLDNSVSVDSNITKFNSISMVDSILNNKIEANFVAMVMLGSFPISGLVERSKTKLSGIRVCFKKNQMNDAIDYCKKVYSMGYDVYMQPASITDYSNDDILRLVNLANTIPLKAFYIVDTYGLMKTDEVLHYYNIIKDNLHPNIIIGFHSHNNLQLSFANSIKLIELANDRDLYIDCSVFGIGRGAGNLCTELITDYLNEKFGVRYKLIPILDIIDQVINNIYKNKKWGYSAEYYISAKNKCHPNYATYLITKNLNIKDVNYILTNIPDDKKRVYDEEVIEQIYTHNLNKGNFSN